MKTFKIYGSSDDLIVTSGLKGCDEFNVMNGGTWQLFIDTPGTLATEEMPATPKQRLGIVANYMGSWAFSVFAVDGDSDKFPDWFQYDKLWRSFGRDCRYSETLEIDCPDNAKLVFKE